ncbi:MAG UNVERIFIED_CONTAM: hypothetical protein LVR18_21640 [Planctomycetaceae bacterium]
MLVERHYEDFLPTRWRSTPLRIVRRLIRPLIEREYNRSVLELLQMQGLEFLLAFKGMLLHPDTLLKFQQRGIPIYCLYPDVSFQDHGANIHNCMPLYDCLFTTKSYHLDDPSITRRVKKSFWCRMVLTLRFIAGFRSLLLWNNSMGATHRLWERGRQRKSVCCRL